MTHRWRRLALGAALLIAAGCRTEPATPPPAALPEGPAVPRAADSTEVAAPGERIDFTLPTLDGDSLTLASLRGHVVLVNFWATWCVPCREEIPDLNQLVDDLGPKGLRIVGVSLDLGGAEVVRTFAQDHPMNYPVLLGDAGLPDRVAALMVMPTTLVVDQAGKLVRRLPGRLQVADVRPLLESLLAG